MPTYSGVKTIEAADPKHPYMITAAEALECGDLITADGYKADGDNARYAEFVAGLSVASGDPVPAYRVAVVEFPSGAALSGAGTGLFLGDTAGDPDESAGTVLQQVGVELSTTQALLTPGKWIGWANYSWGTVLEQAHHIYLNDDYTVYIGSSVTNIMYIGTSAGAIQFRCGAHGVAVAIDNDGLSTAYRIRTTGTLDFGPNHTGVLFLPRRTEPITQPAEGTIWYNTTNDKIEFATASAMEQVTSA